LAFNKGDYVAPCREGTTIKALQNYTNAAIQIEQSVDPCVVRITGNARKPSLPLDVAAETLPLTA
jgi:hypothetical protein